jgi:hypothetical protein
VHFVCESPLNDSPGRASCSMTPVPATQIYVVDSTAPDSFAGQRAELAKYLAAFNADDAKHLQHVPVLLVCSKQDLAGAVKPAEVLCVCCGKARRINACHSLLLLTAFIVRSLLAAHRSPSRCS